VDANVSWPFVLVEGGEKVWCFDGNIVGQADCVSECCDVVANVVDGVADFIGEGGFGASFAVKKWSPLASRLPLPHQHGVFWSDGGTAFKQSFCCRRME
jgi:hypothetical protein